MGRIGVVLVPAPSEILFGCGPESVGDSGRVALGLGLCTRSKCWLAVWFRLLGPADCPHGPGRVSCGERALSAVKQGDGTPRVAPSGRVGS